MAALREQFQAFIDVNLSPAARSATLAGMARQMRADLIASGRAVDDYDTFVDGREGAPESAVRGTGGGTIAYYFNYMAPAATYALAFLRARSPVRGGDFRDSFYFGINDRFVPASAFARTSVPRDAKVTIGNRQPYSRKIDMQMDGTRPLHFSVPAGLFDDCVRAVRRQFGGTIKAKRVYSLSFPGQYQLRHTPGGPVQSPAIVLSAVQ